MQDGSRIAPARARGTQRDVRRNHRRHRADGGAEPLAQQPDTILAFFTGYESGGATVIDYGFLAKTARAVIEFSSSGLSSVAITPAPGMDSIVVRWEFTTDRLLVYLDGLHTLAAPSCPKPIMRITSDAPIAFVRASGYGDNGEAVNATWLTKADFQGDLNLNRVPYEISDIVLFGHLLSLGTSVFEAEPILQRWASDVNGDGTVCDPAPPTSCALVDASCMQPARASRKKTMMSSRTSSPVVPAFASSISSSSDCPSDACRAAVYQEPLRSGRRREGRCPARIQK